MATPAARSATAQPGPAQRGLSIVGARSYLLVVGRIEPLPVRPAAG